MRIPVFAIGVDPSVTRPFIRKSVSYCMAEVNNGRAFQVDASDIRAGIQLSEASHRNLHAEARGSKEQSGCVTAYESSLSAEYRGDTRNLGKLSMQYEHVLDKHIRDGRKGLPRQCGVIAARVKTILSTPTIRFA